MKGTQYHQASRSIKMEVHIYFDGMGNPPMIVTPEDYLVKLKIIEESSAQGEHPMGQISANVLDLVLYNENDIFTPMMTPEESENKILPEVPIEVYCYEETEPEDITFLGTYYVSDWTANSGSSLAEVTAYDLLAQYLHKETPNIAIQKDISLGDFFIKLFEGVGVSKNRLELDPTLFEVNMPFGFVTEKEFGTVLQLLSEAFLVYIDVTRNGLFRVVKLSSIKAEADDLWDDDYVIEMALQYDMLRTYNEIAVTYAKYQESEPRVLATIQDLELPMYKTEVRGVVPDEGPIFNLQCLQGVLPSGVYPLRFIYAPWEIHFDLYNKYVKTVVPSISVFGTTLETLTTTTYKVSDEVAVKRLGNKLFEYKNIYLMQEKEVREGAQLLLSHCINNNTIRTSSVRGNPAVAPGDIILRQGAANNTLELITSQELEYDGALTCQATTRVLREVDLDDYL